MTILIYIKKNKTIEFIVNVFKRQESQNFSLDQRFSFACKAQANEDSFCHFM